MREAEAEACAGVKREAERIAPAEVWTLALGFGLALLVERGGVWLHVSALFSEIVFSCSYRAERVTLASCLVEWPGFG
jgi:hypothetical protein